MQEVHATDRIHEPEEGFYVLCDDFFIQIETEKDLTMMIRVL
jgi:hypothetical protein